MAVDSDVVLYSGTVTASITDPSLNKLDKGGPDITPVTWELLVTAVSGTTPSLLVELYESDNGTTFRKHVAFESVSAVGKYYVTAKSDARYVGLVANVSGTSPSFTIQVAPVPAGEYTKW